MKHKKFSFLKITKKSEFIGIAAVVAVFMTFLAAASKQAEIEKSTFSKLHFNLQ